jgi:arsenate reductase
MNAPAPPSITIYHNPACQTSRKALAAIRAAGHDPDVVEYLQVGWTVDLLRKLLAEMKAKPRILRLRGTPAAELGLRNPAASDDDILAAMVAHPVLVERPIVVTPKGTAIARPIEAIEKLL